jgi:hypothetical protein
MHPDEIAPMAESTEAACLLHSGALYPLRRGYLPSTGDPIFIGVKQGAFSIYFGDEPIYHFDLEGRWQRAFINGLHFLKGLDTTIQALDRVREGENLVLQRRTLGAVEATNLDEQIRNMAIELRNRLGSSLRPLDPPDGVRALTDDQALDLLDRVANWDLAAWNSHRQRFAATYESPPFLPPETSNPVILEATLGRRGLGFGGATGGPDREDSPGRFAGHARDVASLIGRRVLQCRQVFLAGEDVLRRPPEAILEDFDAAAEVFPIAETRSRPRARDIDPLNDAPRLDGFHAFLHEFDRPPFSAEVWEEFRQRRFERLILGIESGSARVRGLYGRDWENESLAKWVASCPIGLGLIVLVGAGGTQSVHEHVQATSELLSTLDLRPGTLISLVDASDLVGEGEAPAEPVLGQARQEPRPPNLSDRARIAPSLEPLDSMALARQRVELKARLAAEFAPRKVKVATYSIDKRWS